MALIRIVRMGFAPDKVEAFLELFKRSHQKIRSFPGCLRLELLQDAHDPSVYMTYSWWESEAALEQYRHSELFKATWAKTKVLFNAKPMAFSSYSRILLE